jgi:DNA repair photolyase
MYQQGLFDQTRPRYIPKSGNLIYQAGAKAGEYGILGCNIYKGCTHKCRYCYNDSGRFENYFQSANPKKNYLERLKKELIKMAGYKVPEIFLSFVGDVYQPAETELELTRNTLRLLISASLSFTILTKGGMRAARDFDLMAGYSACSFGTSLVFMNQKSADHWEPGAAPITDRIAAIEKAKAMGIRTWISLEPVIEPQEALAVIRELNPFIDYWRIGKLNHHPEIKRGYEWTAFRKKAEAMLSDLNAASIFFS